MKKSPVWSNVFRRKPEPQRVLTLLKNIPIFCTLRKPELKEIERIVHYRNYRSGEVVIYEKDVGCCMFVLQDGEVDIFSGYDKPEPLKLATLAKGDFFGEMALLLDSDRGATVVCSQDCSMLAIYREELFQIFEKHSGLGVKVLRKLAEVLAWRLKLSNEGFQVQNNSTGSEDGTTQN